MKQIITLCLGIVAASIVSRCASAEDVPTNDWAIEIEYDWFRGGELRVTLHSSGVVVVRDTLALGPESPRNVVRVSKCEKEDLEIILDCCTKLMDKWEPSEPDQSKFHWSIKIFKGGPIASNGLGRMLDVPKEDPVFLQLLRAVNKSYPLGKVLEVDLGEE